MLNIFDIAVLAIILISGLIAMPRGLFKEVFSLLNWGIAAFAGFHGAIEFGPMLAPKYIQDPRIAIIVAGVCTAIFTFIIITMITSKISNALLNNPLGIIDRLLGLAFGLARGVIIVVPSYWLLRNFISEDTSPYLVAQATKPYLEMGRDWIASNEPYFKDQLSMYFDRINEIISKITNVMENPNN